MKREQLMGGLILCSILVLSACSTSSQVNSPAETGPDVSTEQSATATLTIRPSKESPQPSLKSGEAVKVDSKIIKSKPL